MFGSQIVTILIWTSVSKTFGAINEINNRFLRISNIRLHLRILNSFFVTPLTLSVRGMTLSTNLTNGMIYDMYECMMKDLNKRDWLDD